MTRYFKNKTNSPRLHKLIQSAELPKENSNQKYKQIKIINNNNTIISIKTWNNLKILISVMK